MEGLCRRLLAHGGSLVVPPRFPSMILMRCWLARRGSRRRFSLFREVTVPVMRTWRRCGSTVRIPSIGTGYALSDDDLWRQHSWGVAVDGVVVETTVEREIYVGIVLSARAANM